MKYYDGMGRDVSTEVQNMITQTNALTEECAKLTLALESCMLNAAALEQENTKLKTTVKELRRLKNVPEVT